MAVPITKRILPKGREYGRPGYKLTGVRTITIHNTANERAGADAEAHAKYLEGGRRVSWHFTVDHDSIVQHIPLDEQAWHTGTTAGNTTSIGIEICEYPQTADGRKLQAKAEANGAWLAAKLMKDLKVPMSGIRTHKSWSGKNCPRDLLPRWDEFKKMIDREYAGVVTAKPKKKAPAWYGKVIRNTFFQRSRRDARVLAWQKKMRSLGWNLAADGRFGPVSEKTLRIFQERHRDADGKKLIVDGILGPKSWYASFAAER